MISTVFSALPCAGAREERAKLWKHLKKLPKRCELGHLDSLVGPQRNCKLSVKGFSPCRDLTLIEDILKAELDRNRKAWEQAKLDFGVIAANASSVLPASDGATRIERAAAVHNLALRDYTRVRQELKVFLLNGTVPDRLKGE